MRSRLPIKDCSIDLHVQPPGLTVKYHSLVLPAYALSHTVGVYIHTKSHCLYNQRAETTWIFWNISCQFLHISTYLLLHSVQVSSLMSYCSSSRKFCIIMQERNKVWYELGFRPGYTNSNSGDCICHCMNANMFVKRCLWDMSSHFLKCGGISNCPHPIFFQNLNSNRRHMFD